MQIAQELELGRAAAAARSSRCARTRNAKVRARRSACSAKCRASTPDVLLDKVLNDPDARVRANAIEVLEPKRKPSTSRCSPSARSSHNRERANAIKAMHKMKVGTATTALLAMLSDERAEHRISALWALRQIGWWQLLNEVGRLAKEDTNLRVRRYALQVLRGAADVLAEAKKAE